MSFTKCVMATNKGEDGQPSFSFLCDLDVLRLKQGLDK